MQPVDSSTFSDVLTVTGNEVSIVSGTVQINLVMQYGTKQCSVGTVLRRIKIGKDSMKNFCSYASAIVIWDKLTASVFTSIRGHASNLTGIDGSLFCFQLVLLTPLPGRLFPSTTNRHFVVKIWLILQWISLRSYSRQMSAGYLHSVWLMYSPTHEIRTPTDITS